jgi:predicted nucleotidyltransferase
MRGEASARTVAERFADACRDILGGDARSLILHGSLAAGGFRPGHSDIDILAVLGHSPADPQLDALERVVRQADLGSAAGIDLHVVTAAAAGTPARTPPLELHIGRYDGSSIGVEIERRLAAAPDLPTELSMARADGVALSGAQPRAVIGPVPAQWIVERGRHWLTKWQSLTGDAENAAFMVLTACRIWHFAVRNAHCSKIHAAEWALGRKPSLTAVRQATHQYERDHAGPISEDAVADVLDTVLRDTAPVR